jgi:hypothetical protein
MFRLKPCTQRVRFDVNEIQSKRLQIQKDELITVLGKYIQKERTRDETRQDLIAIRVAVKEGCR